MIAAASDAPIAEDAASFVTALLACAALTPLFARLAVRRGWVDDGSDAADRKPQARAVPLVGGTAIVVACLVAHVVGRAFGARGALDWIEPVRGAIVGSTASIWIVSSLALAYLAGLVDDLAPRGLAPQHKLAGQTLAACALAAGCAALGAEPRWSSALAWLVAGVWAQNALNTFDNADGVAAAVTLCGTAAAAPAIAGAVCGFLPFNLWIRRGDAGASERTTPVAYLGDSGSHLLGLALLLHPVARWALLVPSLDLLRVVIVRMRSGRAPWIGDRRHVAHRMSSAGWSRTSIVLTLCAITAPAIVGAALTEFADTGSTATWIGSAVTLAGFLTVLRASRGRA